jgi:predicted phosphate transport protein (TIGR00153 family)
MELAIIFAVMKIFPRKIDFFEIFNKCISNLVRTTAQLVDLMENFENVEDKVKQLYELEQEGDLLTHDIMRRLNQTFITPIDREDIHVLAARIDDIVDMIWGGVDRMAVFRIDKPTKDAVHLARELHTTAEVIQKAMKELEAKDYDHVKEHCIEINRMENRIDRTFRNALGELFDDFADNPALIIKWKDVYEHFEEAADKCEDVANILEGIVLKHA